MTKIFFNYSSLYGFEPVKEWVETESLQVKDTKYDALTYERKVLVLSGDISIYKNCELATPYLNYQISKIHMQSPDYYDNLTAIYNNFQKDMPQVIIDENELVSSLFKRMPKIGSYYRKSIVDGAWVLRVQ